jgi:hypothetical protein
MPTFPVAGQYVKIEAGHKGYYVWDVTTLNVQTDYDHGSPSCAGYGSLGCDTQINAPSVTDERNTYRRTLNHLSNITKLVNPLPPPNLWRMEKHFTKERRTPQ